MKKVALVVPLLSEPAQEWVDAVKKVVKQSSNHVRVVLVVDEKSYVSSKNPFRYPLAWKILTYSAQKRLLRSHYEKFAKIFHGSSAIRVVGHLWAYANKYDVIIGLETSCTPKKGFIEDHVAFLGEDYGSGWLNPYGITYPAGFPSSQRNWKVVANMGLHDTARIVGSTPVTGYTAFSGQNFAVTADAALGLMFFPHMDSGDMLGGYLFQKLMEIRHESMMVGYPLVKFDETSEKQTSDTSEDSEELIRGDIDYSAMYQKRAIRELGGSSYTKLLADMVINFAPSSMWASRNIEALLWWALVIAAFERTKK